MMEVSRRLLLGLMLMPAAARAQPPEGRGQGRGGSNDHPGGKGRGQGAEHGRGRGGPADHGRPGLGEHERSVIQGWIAANPGFAAQPLPPGMANRLARGKGLPPGIARRALPPDLLHRLPSWPGHQYLAVGATVVLIEIATGIVRQILTDALLRR